MKYIIGSQIKYCCNIRKTETENGGECSRGPVVMIVGPTDSGKTSLCKLLVNWSRYVELRFSEMVTKICTGSANSY